MTDHGSLAEELTRQLVRIDSTDPGAFEGEIGRFLQDWFLERGIAAQMQEALPGRHNLIARIPGTIDDPALIYICHMDTVPVGDGWTMPPFEAVLDRGRIYGRGSCDMKSGLACAMSAFASIAARGRTPEHTFLLIATVDEEDFMRGVEKVIASGLVTEHSWVLDTEPTDGQIQASHKGRTWFEVTVRGITAHAGTPWKGADAVAATALAIDRIRRAVKDLPAHLDLGRSTVTFGQIQGGYRPYVVPDSCRLWIDMRLVPPADTGKAEEIVRQALQAAKQEVPGTEVSYRITGDRPPVERDDGSCLLAGLKEAVSQVTGSPARVGPFPGYTDTAVIAASLCNHNCMSYGPGNLEQAHKPDESVPCEDIRRCERVLTVLAENLLFGRSG